MSAEDEQSQSGYDDGLAGGPGAPTPLSALDVCIDDDMGRNCLLIMRKGIAGLTKRDINLFVEAGYNTVESVAYTPRKILETIKGVSEQKATKILTEGTFCHWKIQSIHANDESQPPNSYQWDSQRQQKCTLDDQNSSQSRQVQSSSILYLLAV